MLKKSLSYLAFGAATVLGANSAMAQAIYYPASQPIVHAGMEQPKDEGIAAPAHSPVGGNYCSPSCCEPCGGGWLSGLLGGRDWAGSVFFAGDGWTNRTNDEDGNSNFGFRTGFNVGTQLRGDWGFQVGASIGGYDFHGRNDGTENKVESQIFGTAGVFRRANSCSPYLFAAVLDWTHSENYGENGAAGLDLFQFRGLAGYMVNECDEIGVWSNLRINRDIVDWDTGINPHVHALSQINLYWRHYWCYGAETMVYAGLPMEEPGEFVVGGNSLIPVSDRVALFATVHYIIPSTSGGDFNNNNFDDSYSEETWNISAGIALYFGGNRCCSTSCDDMYLPLLPVADNGTFPVAADSAERGD